MGKSKKKSTMFFYTVKTFSFQRNYVLCFRVKAFPFKSKTQNSGLKASRSSKKQTISWSESFLVPEQYVPRQVEAFPFQRKKTVF